MIADPAAVMPAEGSGGGDPENSWSALVDGHVHLYDCYDQRAFLHGAFANLGRESTRARPGAFGVLCFTEDRRHDGFATLAVAVRRDGDQLGFRLAETGEDESYWLESLSGTAVRRLLVVAGQQVETRERLELLALGMRARVPDGRSLTETVRAVTAEGGVPVLPWAFGKWWSERGRVVQAYLEAMMGDRSGSNPPVFPGDNAGRPAGMPDPRPFRFARAHGIPVLPGTDPLPLPAHAGRAGTYGFVLDGTGLLDRPAEALRQALHQTLHEALQVPPLQTADQTSPPSRRRARGASIVSFGTRSSWVAFARDQVRLRTSAAVRAERALPVQGRDG